MRIAIAIAALLPGCLTCGPGTVKDGAQCVVAGDTADPVDTEVTDTSPVDDTGGDGLAVAATLTGAEADGVADLPGGGALVWGTLGSGAAVLTDATGAELSLSGLLGTLWIAALDADGAFAWHGQLDVPDRYNTVVAPRAAGGASVVAWVDDALVVGDGPALMTQPPRRGEGLALVRLDDTGAPVDASLIAQGVAAEPDPLDLKVAALRADPDGGAVLVGSFAGELDVGTLTLSAAGTYRDHCGGRCPDGFVLRLDADGAVAWAQRVGGTAWDEAHEVAWLADGGVVVAGQFLDELVLSTPTGDRVLTGVGDPTGLHHDVFAAAFDADGTPRWAFGAGDEERSDAIGLAADADAVYLAARFDGATWLAGLDDPDAVPVLSLGAGDEGAVVRLDPLTGAMTWVTPVGARSSTYGTRDVLALAPDGVALAMGYDGDVAFGTGAGAVELDGPGAYVAHLGPDGAVRDVTPLFGPPAEGDPTVHGLTAGGWVAGRLALPPDDTLVAAAAVR